MPVMAARPMFAAASADTSESFSVLKNIVSSLPRKVNGRKHVYDRDSLLDIRQRCGKRQPRDLHRLSKFRLLHRGCTPGSLGATATKKHYRRRCDRTRKRGKRGGLSVRLRANPCKPAVPSVLLANVRSLDTKMDYISIWRSLQRGVRDCCVFVFTETWLTDKIPDSGIELEGLTLHRADRVMSTSGKLRGGGLAIYTNNSWCYDARTIFKSCSPDVEFMTVKCRPFYLPRELAAIFITVVYVPPNADVKQAMGELYKTLSQLQTTNPDAFYIVAGDFNKANLKSVLPNFYQHVTCATRGKNTLDHLYTNIKNAYVAAPLPHIGSSDHLTILLKPEYRPRVRQEPPVVKEIRVWPQEAFSSLQGCFECTQWNIFKEAATSEDCINLEEYTETVLGFISKCIDDVTIIKTVKLRSTDKSWLTSKVRSLLRLRDAAFRSDDTEAYNLARSDLKRAIREAKSEYGKKLASNFNDTRDTRRLWQGFQTAIGYKPTVRTTENDPSLIDNLNNFFSRFEIIDEKLAQRQVLPPINQAVQLTSDSVKRVFSKINPRKAAGPDYIPGCVLKRCAEQLKDVFTDIFNISLSQAKVPICFKSATIIPLPKTPNPATMNDYRPVALTPIAMKCFEQLVMNHIKSCLPTSLDPLQFAYRANRSTEDALSTLLHLSLTHLENRNTYVRILFIDFSSAFNTILPQQLIEKLLLLGVDLGMCGWILDFLTERRQTVRMGNKISKTTTVSTGLPQGCVLSPLLFTLLTHDCSASFNTNHILKFADDTTVVGLITDNDESAYREEVEQLIAWCKKHNLALNTKKTKEMVVDFRRTSHRHHPPLTINGSEVDIVHSVKFLGFHLTDELTSRDNTTVIIKRAQQRLYSLRRLKKVDLPIPALIMFYRGTIESILTYCISCWFGNSTADERHKLNRIVRTAEKIIGASLPCIQDIYTERCVHRANSIIKDFTYFLRDMFILLQSGKRYRSIRARTSRLLNSFFPTAIRLLNQRMGFEI